MVEALCFLKHWTGPDSVTIPLATARSASPSSALARQELADRCQHVEALLQDLQVRTARARSVEHGGMVGGRSSQ